MKKFLFGIIMFIVLVGSFSVFASKINASNIEYENTTLDKALDDLYSNPATRKFCELKSGTANTIGSKYECDPGDGIKRNFFVLSVDNNKVKLIMEHNITEGSSATTMTWMDAMKYFKTEPGVSTKNSWVNVQDVDLPNAQEIADAVGNTGWTMEDKKYADWFFFDMNNNTYGQQQVANTTTPSNYQWLYNYTRECTTYGCDSETSLGSTEAYGYWTTNVVVQQSTGAWNVDRGGRLYIDTLSHTYNGVRPVITVLKINLY